jgi:Rieske Fe-S protein
MTPSPPHAELGPNTTRRGFLEAFLASGIVTALASICYPIVRFVMPPKVAESQTVTVVACQVADLPPNSGKLFKFGSRPGIVIRTPAGEYRAFSAICTHLQCTVQYRNEYQGIWCACHNGRFDLAGRNVSGPPPQPLEAYDVAIRGTDVVVSKRA